MLQKSMSKKSSIRFCERCDICYKDYNLDTNKPLIICQSNHSICKVCLIAIRQKPICPFCRKLVSYKRIRLNYDVVLQIKNKNSRINPQAEFSILKIGQTMRKGQDLKEINQNYLANVFLDESEFRQEEDEQQRDTIQEQLGIRCSIFQIFLYLYFVFLQLPLGSVNLCAGINIDKNQCSFAQANKIYFQLGLSYKTIGGIQIILSLHFLYLRYIYKIKKVSEVFQRIFDIILSFFVILKSSISIVIFIKFLHEKALSACIPQVYDFIAINLFVNYFAILFGLNIILRLCCLMQAHH